MLNDTNLVHKLRINQLKVKRARVSSNKQCLEKTWGRREIFQVKRPVLNWPFYIG